MLIESCGNGFIVSDIEDDQLEGTKVFETKEHLILFFRGWIEDMLEQNVSDDEVHDANESFSVSFSIGTYGDEE